ncbi:hypothetical protein ACLOJK_034958 [Asimina triloba]
MAALFSVDGGVSGGFFLADRQHLLSTKFGGQLARSDHSSKGQDQQVDERQASPSSSISDDSTLGSHGNQIRKQAATRIRQINDQWPTHQLISRSLKSHPIMAMAIRGNNN